MQCCDLEGHPKSNEYQGNLGMISRNLFMGEQWGRYNLPMIWYYSICIVYYNMYIYICIILSYIYIYCILYIFFLTYMYIYITLCIYIYITLCIYIYYFVYIYIYYFVYVYIYIYIYIYTPYHCLHWHMNVPQFHTGAVSQRNRKMWIWKSLDWWPLMWNDGHWHQYHQYYISYSIYIYIIY